MNPRQIRLIISDLDQTLLHQDKSVSAYSYDVLRRCQQAGYLVGLATARSEPSARELLPGLAPDVIISSGGALARSGEKEWFSKTLSPAQSEHILTCAAHAPDVGKITAHVKEGVYWNLPADSRRPPGYAHHRQYDFTVPFLRETYCMTIATKNGAWARALAAGLEDCEHIEYTGENLHRFGRAGADKASALRACCQALGIGLEAVLAFGDDVNDVDMLAACPLGVAVANAVPAAQAAAHLVLPLTNQEDGVAQYLDAVLLRPLREA